jgi:hypothetical protein
MVTSSGATLDEIAFGYVLRVEQWVDEKLGRQEGQVAHYANRARELRA